MNALAHSSNVRAGKTPITQLDPGHSRKAGTSQAMRAIRNRKIRRTERARLQSTRGIWQ